VSLISCKIVSVEPIEGSKVEPEANEEKASQLVNQEEQLVPKPTFCERNSDVLELFKATTIIFGIFSNCHFMHGLSLAFFSLYFVGLNSQSRVF
jgi:hypothetical protein